MPCGKSSVGGTGARTAHRLPIIQHLPTVQRPPTDVQEVMHVQQDELQLLQLAVYRKEIDDDVEDCYRHFLDADGSIAAYSQHVLGRDSGSGPVADEDAPELGSGKAKQMLVIGQGDLRIDAPWVSALQYLHAPGTAVRHTAAQALACVAACSQSEAATCRLIGVGMHCDLCAG